MFGGEIAMYSKYLQMDLLEIANFIKTMELSDRTVMVTGATGLIGSLIIKSVIQFNRKEKEKINVIGMARDVNKVQDLFQDEFCENQYIPYVRFIYQDISEPVPEDIECSYIIHTANSTSSHFFITNPVEVIESIYSGTKQILEYAKNHDVKGIVYLSSMEVFGTVCKAERLSEEDLGYLDIHNIRSCYSEGKRLAELLCKSYAEEYGLPVRVARLAQTFGAGISDEENRVFAQFARNAMNGDNIVLHTRGQSVGNYCYTSDTIKAILLLLKEGTDGEAYTVVNEDATMSIADMAQMVAGKFSGGKSTVVFDIQELNKYGYAPDTKMKLSAKKLNKLGWKATVDLEEMYKRMIFDIWEKR